ncbi:hypothetical protein WR25_18541 [Diploscapter pachys]|uniref:Uncharacterized protein n=1 Tax=Diploscapter pachys TaxID=2018661 RepID=A0A2A2M585_9BILA|nr:hypothetical protein WR25_18541 [Diploscapter pachys]
MTTSMIAVSWSTRSDQSTAMSPLTIQVSTGTTCAVLVPARKPRKIGHDSRHDTNSAPVVMTLAGTKPIALLPSPATAAASSGRNTMNKMACTEISPSSG